MIKEHDDLTVDTMRTAMLNRDTEFNGRFYVGVKTTGIYCLPSCRGRPKPENVVFFKTKREAERSGFRACKACFPGLPVGRWQDNGHSVSLMAPNAFSFSEALVYLRRSQNECLHHVGHDKVVKLLGIDGRKVLIEVGYQNDGIIEVRFLNGKPRKPVRMAAAQYVWEWFDLETDLTPFYQAAEGDPLLKKLVHEYFGLRIG